MNQLCGCNVAAGLEDGYKRRLPFFFLDNACRPVAGQVCRDLFRQPPDVEAHSHTAGAGKRRRYGVSYTTLQLRPTMWLSCSNITTSTRRFCVQAGGLGDDPSGIGGRDLTAQIEACTGDVSESPETNQPKTGRPLILVTVWPRYCVSVCALSLSCPGSFHEIRHVWQSWWTLTHAHPQ